MESTFTDFGGGVTFVSFLFLLNCRNLIVSFIFIDYYYFCILCSPNLLFNTLVKSCAQCTGSIWFASEMKALSDDCERFIAFPPGHIYSSKQGMLLPSS